MGNRKKCRRKNKAAGKTNIGAPLIDKANLGDVVPKYFYSRKFKVEQVMHWASMDAQQLTMEERKPFYAKLAEKLASRLIKMARSPILTTRQIAQQVIEQLANEGIDMSFLDEACPENNTKPDQRSPISKSPMCTVQ